MLHGTRVNHVSEELQFADCKSLELQRPSRLVHTLAEMVGLLVFSLCTYISWIATHSISRTARPTWKMWHILEGEEEESISLVYPSATR